MAAQGAKNTFGARMAYALVVLALTPSAMSYPYPAGGSDKCNVHCATAGYMMPKTTIADASSACTQGCALLTMYQLDANARSLDSVTGVHQTPKQACSSACAQAWAGQSALIEACAAGCAAQNVLNSPGGVSVSLDSNSPLYPFAQKAVDVQFKGMGGMLDRFRNLVPSWPVWNQNAQSPVVNEWPNNNNNKHMLLGGDGHDMMPHGMGMGNQHHMMPHGMGMGMGNQHHMMMHDHQPMLMIDPPAWFNQRDPFKSDPFFSDNNKMSDKAPWPESMRDMHDRMVKALKNAFRIIDEDKDKDKADLRFRQVKPVTQEGQSKVDVNTVDSVRAFEPSPPVDQFSERHVLVPMHDGHYDHQHQSWLACLRARARHLNRVTRWTVCLALTLCAASLVFLCVALARRHGRVYYYYGYGQPNAAAAGKGGVKTVSAGVPDSSTTTKIPFPDPPTWEPNPPPTPPLTHKSIAQGHDHNEGPPPAYDEKSLIGKEDKEVVA